MLNIFYNFITQSLPFLPLALAIYISFNLMNATDMTLDGSFVTGAGVFAKMVTLGFSPVVASLLALLAGVCTGNIVALMQHQRRIDPLLAGVLATFMLVSGNLILMGRPNINLLSQETLVSNAFADSEIRGYLLVGLIVALLFFMVFFLLRSSFGLCLRAFGNNPLLFSRYGFNSELYRTLGFSLTNALAACSGCLTAQVIGYADINMSLGLTLTGLGAIIAGQHLTLRLLKCAYLRTSLEFLACLMGVFLYFALMNTLLSIGVDPLYLKILLGFILVFFLRSASSKSQVSGGVSC